jgi:hypothetical protein
MNISGTFASVAIASSTAGNTSDHFLGFSEPKSYSEVFEKTWATNPATGTSMLAGISMGQWSNAISVLETRNNVTSGYSLYAEPSLIDKLDEFQLRMSTELCELKATVDLLARAIEWGTETKKHLDDMAFVAATPSEESLILAEGDGSLSDILDHIADGLLDAPSNTIDFALKGLKSTRPELRAAAGRALSALQPELARKYLPAAIDNESNKFAKATLVGALGSAL